MWPDEVPSEMEPLRDLYIYPVSQRSLDQLDDQMLEETCLKREADASSSEHSIVSKYHSTEPSACLMDVSWI